MCIWWRLCVCSVGQGGMLSTCINVCAHVCSLYGCGGCMHGICVYEMTYLCWFDGVCVRWKNRVLDFYSLLISSCESDD